MSLILDALERSQRERTGPRPGDPVRSPGAEGRQVPAAASLWMSLLLLALVLALSTIAWLWVFRAPPTVPDPPPMVVAPVADLPGPPASVEVLPRRVVAAEDSLAGRPGSGAADKDVFNLYREARAARVSATASTTDGQSRRARSSENPAADTPEQAAVPTPAQAERDAGGVGEHAEAAPQVDTLVARAREALDNRGMATHPAPMLAELSQEIRDTIPTLMYSQHDYRDDGVPSSVLINRKRRVKGDSVSGVRVDKILPDSVVLHYRGTVFRLRALNSWVNL